MQSDFHVTRKICVKFEKNNFFEVNLNEENRKRNGKLLMRNYFS